MQHLEVSGVVRLIQGVTGGRDQTSGGCSLCETIPKKPKTPTSKIVRRQRVKILFICSFFTPCKFEV